jgi:hypothetical protein
VGKTKRKSSKCNSSAASCGSFQSGASGDGGRAGNVFGSSGEGLDREGVLCPLELYQPRDSVRQRKVALHGVGGENRQRVMTA